MAQQEAKINLTAEDRFSATFASLKRQIAQGDAALAGFGSRVGGLGVSLGALAGAGAAVVGGLTFIRRMATDLDALNDASAAVGDTVENLSALEDVARRNGGGIDLVTTSLVKLNQVLGSAKEDSAAARALKALGLEAAELRRKAPTQALRDVAVALNRFENDGNKARNAQELLGRSIKELAPFLKDLAEAGELNATVTTRQADEARRFNEAMFELQTNVSNAARGIASDAIPVLNNLIEAFRGNNAEAGRFPSIVKAITVPMEALSVLGANVAFVFKGIGTEMGGIAAQTAALARGDFAAFAGIRREMVDDAKRARAELDALEQRIMSPGTGAGAGRGFINPELPRPRVPADNARAANEQASAGERYVETLKNQREQLEGLTHFEKALRDIQQERIKGLTPELRHQIIEQSHALDLDKEATAEKEKQLRLEKELKNLRQRQFDRAQTLIAATPSGVREQAEADIEALMTFSRQFSDGSPQHRAISEALEMIRKKLKEIGEEAGNLEDPFEHLANSIEKSMDRATQAILDFVIEGKGSTKDLFKAFARDLLRKEIEAPIREVMTSVSDIIKNALKDISTKGQSGFGSIIGSIGRGIGDFFTSIFGGRANGGPVRKGRTYWVGENGPEPFIPSQDGTILSNAAARGMGGGQQVVNVVNNVTVNGDVSPRTVQLINAALTRNNAALARSMRLGGPMAPA